jgi:hypothetical protein
MGPTAHVSAAKGDGERNDADTNGSDTSSDEDDGGCFILSQEPHRAAWMAGGWEPHRYHPMYSIYTGS